MKILALDIGAGTQDILLYDDSGNIENCIKLVLPSPHLIFAAKVREATKLHQDLFVKGDIIGGGAFAVALRNHIERGFRVLMTEKSAYTVRNSLDEVKELGIEITQGQPESFSGKTLKIKEVDLSSLGSFLARFNENLTDLDAVAVAVQDHGVSPKGISNRKFRIQKMLELLKENPRPENLAFGEDEIPPYFLRMRSAAQASRRQLPEAKVVVMDTSPAAILGCLKDPALKEVDPILVVNVGNGHTMIAIMKESQIIGLLDHHTHLINPEKIERLIIDFANGALSYEEIFNDNGHGLFLLEKPPGFSKIKKIAATGPKRNILSKISLPVYFAAPAGDVMMTGPIGLVEAAKKKLL